MERIALGALVRDGHVLLVHRGSHRLDHPGRWDLPGGHVEAGESDLDALVRELSEELGVQVAADRVTHLTRWTREDGPNAPVFNAWLVLQWEGTASNNAPDEHDDIRWFAAEELPPLIPEALRSSIADALAPARRDD